MDNIDISDLDFCDLLVELYHGTHALGLGFLHNSPHFNTSMAKDVFEDIQKSLDDRGWATLDYVYGRPIKIDLTKAADGKLFIRTDALYDRDAGRGSLMRIIEDMRTGPARTRMIHEKSTHD